MWQQANLVQTVDGLNATRVGYHHAAAVAVRAVGDGRIIMRPNRIELGQIDLRNDDYSAKPVEVMAEAHLDDLAAGAGSDLHGSTPRAREGKGKARPVDA